MRKVYLDHAATTPLHPEVHARMLKLAAEHFGNPMSGHLFGRRARVLLDESLATVAEIIGAERPEDILLTSGGTEANNLALKGVMGALDDGAAVALTAVEHASVYDTASAMEDDGRRVFRLPVAPDGRLEAVVLEEALDRHPEIRLLSVIWANNELGCVNEMAPLAALCRERNVLLHTDAVQTLGKLRVDLREIPADLLTGSAHKFYGPKGTGFLYRRRGVSLKPLVTGGAQQQGLRGGTENVAGALGMAHALRLAEECREEIAMRLRGLMTEFIGRLEGIEGLRVNAGGQELPGHCSLSFEGVDGEALLLSLDLDGVAVSSGSACHTGSADASRVLLSIGLDERLARGTIRVVAGRDTSAEDLGYAAERLLEHAARLKGTA